MKQKRIKKNGRGDWIRTSDPTVPNRVLYQAEPHPDMINRYSVDSVVIALSLQKGQAPFVCGPTFQAEGKVKMCSPYVITKEKAELSVGVERCSVVLRPAVLSSRALVE